MKVPETSGMISPDEIPDEALDASVEEKVKYLKGALELQMGRMYLTLSELCALDGSDWWHVISDSQLSIGVLAFHLDTKTWEEVMTLLKGKG